MNGESSELRTSMTAIRLWRQQYVRKYIDEGKSLRIVLSVFGESLSDEIKTCYQCCLDSAECCLNGGGCPLTLHTESIRHKHGSQALRN